MKYKKCFLASKERKPIAGLKTGSKLARARRQNCRKWRAGLESRLQLVHLTTWLDPNSPEKDPSAPRHPFPCASSAIVV